MATVTDLVAGTGVGGVQEAAGANYALEEHTVDDQKGGTIYVSRYYKKLAGESGTTGIVFEATGISTVSQVDARGIALSSLNAKRRHRYAGAPQTANPLTRAVGVNALNSATLNCDSTTGFAASGTAYLGGVAFTYTGITATSFTGCGNHAATTGGETITQAAGLVETVVANFPDGSATVPTVDVT